MDEASVLAAISKGDIDRYADLVERYHVGLIIHCERIVHDRDEAEDLAQKAFIKAYEQLSKFDPERSRFSTWLYKIGTNLALDYLRRQKRKVDVSDFEDMEPVFLEDYERTETMRDVREAVAKLTPPEHRHAIEAYYWRGKSYQTIADEMNVPINTVKSWLHRAKQQLRSSLI